MKALILNNFAVGDTHLGKSVFAAREFKKNDVITQFTGPILEKKRLPRQYEGERDRFVQIGVEEFMGPSGEIDDLINHSCEPNAGLKFGESGPLLVALEKIEVGEEITWDYSTTMYKNTWRMICGCRKPSCRKVIGDFTLLPASLQRRYLRLNVIPNYLKDYLSREEHLVCNRSPAQAARAS